MKTTLKIFALLIIGVSMISCSKDADSFDAPIAEIVSFNSLESEILSLVNIHRETLGLQKLSPLAPAYTEATTHSKYMIEQGKISHDNFDVRSRTLMSTASAKVILENVGAGYTSAASLVNAWLNSELHRKNIENPTVQFMGISAQQNASGTKYYTQIFIGR